MHEFSITEGILSIALEKAQEAGAGRITGINVVIGEISTVVSDCVEFYFDFLRKDTIAAGANLAFSRIPFRLRCRRCHTDYSPEANRWVCPGCGEPGGEIISGSECYLESIEVE